MNKFKLSESFLTSYKTAVVPWGPLGYITFKRTFARRLSEFDETTEEWWQTVRRVIEGMFEIQRQHILKNGLYWDNHKAQATAKECFDRLFFMKWLPPGRGLWMMGTDFVEKVTGAALFSCAFRTTKDIATKGGSVHSWMMDALMLGVGVGFDTLGFKKGLTIKKPKYNKQIIKIADSREGWVDSVRQLLDGFLLGTPIPSFNYTLIRNKGEPIKGFGGTASGPGPLIELHTTLDSFLTERVGKVITSTDIVDIENLIGRCVVSGNVRRSAALAIGDADDTVFLTMKNDHEKLMSHRWGSNNSIHAEVGMDYSIHAEQSQKNGEPGYIWLDNARKYGRFKDGITNVDSEIAGFNPCVEQSLENFELCGLVETFPAKHDTYEDFIKTLKCAYLYAKTVTLVNTHWPEANAVMLKNRRIGLSQSGITQAFARHGRREVFDWSDKAYDYLKKLDKIYSNWLCIPRSIKITSVKPSGTVSLLNGSTPGIHYPESEYYIRRIRFARNSSLIGELKKNGYPVEEDKYSPNTDVVSFPVREPFFIKGKKDVSMWEQLENTAQFQYYWSDNAVSVTITFKEEEAGSIKDALQMYETRLKAVSFLKLNENNGYEQAPYEAISKQRYDEMTATIIPLTNLNIVGSGEKFCSKDSCLA